MKTTLRILTENDILPCSEIVGLNYSQEYRGTSEKELRSMFSTAAVRPVYWVAEKEAGIAGFAGYTQSWMDYGVYQIFWVNVHPQFQGQGIGKTLVKKLIEEIKLTATRPNAVYYSQHFGFKKILKINKAPEYLMGLRLSQ